VDESQVAVNGPPTDSFCTAAAWSRAPESDGPPRRAATAANGTVQSAVTSTRARIVHLRRIVRSGAYADRGPEMKSDAGRAGFAARSGSASEFSKEWSIRGRSRQRDDGARLDIHRALRGDLRPLRVNLAGGAVVTVGVVVPRLRLSHLVAGAEL